MNCMLDRHESLQTKCEAISACLRIALGSIVDCALQSGKVDWFAEHIRASAFACALHFVLGDRCSERGDGWLSNLLDSVMRLVASNPSITGIIKSISTRKYSSCTSA